VILPNGFLEMVRHRFRHERLWSLRAAIKGSGNLPNTPAREAQEDDEYQKDNLGQVAGESQ
jgi:hypothetical protein